MASGRLIISASDPCVDSTGKLVAGATLTVYLTGTTNLALIYGNQTLTSPLTNPMISNANGRFYVQSTTIWADVSQGYDVVLAFPDGESYTYTDVFMLGQSTSGGQFMPITGGTFTGPVNGITPAANDNSTLLATTNFVVTALATYAPLASPGFSGTPTAPTPTSGDSSTKLATTAFVQTAISAGANASSNMTISGSVLTVRENTGFSSINRGSAGAFNFTFTTPQANAFYKVFVGLENVTTLQGVIVNKMAASFSVSVLTTSSNVPTDPLGLSVLVVA